MFLKTFIRAKRIRPGLVCIALLTVLLWALQPANAETANADSVNARPAATEPIPAWVDDLPDITETALSDGVLQTGETKWLLQDQQFAWPDGQREVWIREVRQLGTGASVALASQQITEFNFLDEDLILNRALVIRDGVSRDVTARVKAPVPYDRREPTVMIEIPDLRPGDILDFSYLRRSLARTKGFDHRAVARLDGALPSRLRRAVVNWPAGWARNQRPLPGYVSLSQTAQPDGSFRLEYRVGPHEIPDPEPRVPGWIEQQAVLHLSAETDWSALATALAPAYPTDGALGSWQDLPQLRDAGGQALPWPDQVIAAQHLVQDSIIDTGGERSEGPARMRPAAGVIESGYGSPFEKALVLATVLRDRGLEADIALVSTTHGHGLDQLPPAASWFDHAVVRVQKDGQTLWLDPDRQVRIASARTMAPLTYGFALPITRDGRLTPLPAPPEQVWTSDVRETWRFARDGLYADVVTVTGADAAGALRMQLEAEGAEWFTEGLVTYYNNTHPGLVLQAQPEISDDPAANVIRTHERYFISAGAMQENGTLDRFVVFSENFVGELAIGERHLSGYAARRWPMLGMLPGHFRHRVEVQNLPIALIPPDEVRLENAGFTYSRKASAPDQNSLVVEWGFLANGGIIPAGDVPAMMNDAELVQDTTWISYTLRD
ncbi:hypothetical protein HOY34_05430 [Xinfangfangia sp. D13-10-4-6]|uniref:hypothetical protein n=1 Tax=Pseudogemmobacter hezensis TaxID=2737662 RepID=UPI0015547824|nr:hypothetical protein [Pseudogemmobacter hezensis]NPD14644.1 hypothetical protein [Pseudogemmobacter hezensis]